MHVGNDSSVVDDDARLLFYTSLALKLCQQSTLSMFKIFTIFLSRSPFRFQNAADRKLRLFRILPLLRSLKRSRTQDNTVVDESDIDISPSEVVRLIVRLCTTYEGSEDVRKHRYIIALSLLAAPSLVNEVPHEGHSLADQIVCELKVDIWRGAFEYFDRHRESDHLSSTILDIHFRMSSGQPFPSRNSSLDSVPKQAAK
jgi:hypothetical protein